jgi:predicted DCC family thiol-disulfide oxidoreductase YuxK
MPYRSPANRDTFGVGWFDPVPAYRLASLRVALAVTTIVFHVPKFNGLIDAYTGSAFHMPPAFSWIPPLTRTGGVALMVLHHVAAWGLLLGWAPRLCAWFLAAAGFYVMSLDPEYYAHNAQFHLTLLALIGCSTDRVSLRRLMTDDAGGATCLAWPERMIRIQLAVVFSYTAVDKVLSPHWGLSGAVLAAQRLAAHGPGLAWLQRVNEAALRALSGVMSVATIALEFFLAVVFLTRPLWPMGIAIALVFAAYLEFILRPGLFAWDVAAALLVFMPAGDRAWLTAYDPTCSSCRWNRRILSPLDWLRRLRWVTTHTGEVVDSRLKAAGEGARGGLHLISPSGREYRNFEALRLLPIILPGPVLVVMTLAYFAGRFLATRGYGWWDDLLFFTLGCLLALWLPGVARFLGRPVYATILAAWDYCVQSDALAVSRENDACPTHARRAEPS